MTMFCTLPDHAFILMEVWAFLLIAFWSAITVYAVFLKKQTYAAIGTFFVVLCCMICQIAFEAHLLRIGNIASISAFSERVLSLSWLEWFFSLSILTLLAGFLFFRSNRYRRQCVNPTAIKLCADKMPCGICYWRKSGRLILTNLCMDRLCIALTGQPLLNGNSVRNALSGEVVSLNGRSWRFLCREISLDGEPLYEMIASDITEEHSKIIRLEEDAAALSRIKRELQAYQSEIEASVRRHEILQAKINIHDEMNRLMLSTVAAGSAKSSELDSVLSLWEQNALLLCMQAERNGKELEQIEQVAQLLNLRLVMNEALPKSMTAAQRELFISAAQEAIVNAVKHAEATRLTISFEENKNELRCCFENDGRMPSAAVRFTGGLANLSLLAQKQKASIEVEVGAVFRLFVLFSKNGKNHTIG